MPLHPFQGRNLPPPPLLFMRSSKREFPMPSQANIPFPSIVLRRIQTRLPILTGRTLRFFRRSFLFQTPPFLPHIPMRFPPPHSLGGLFESHKCGQFSGVIVVFFSFILMVWTNLFSYPFRRVVPYRCMPFSPLSFP